MIEIEVQNETHQSQLKLRFSAVPRIGEGLRLLEPDGRWASYDVIDVWYQKAEYGDIWVPYLHVRLTPQDGNGLPLDKSVSQEAEMLPASVESPFPQRHEFTE